MHQQARRLPAVLTILLLTLAGCTSDPAPDDRTASTPTTAPTSDSPTIAPAGTPTSYVALGDSFTAGPGIAPQQDDAGFCQRSGRNWPALLAASLKLDVTDVSCSGATTADLASTVASGTPAAGTTLVTVSAGGNDGGLFLSLLRSCSTSSVACESFVDQQVPAVLDRTTSALVSLLDDVRSAAPTATVVLVGYPRIMPETGTCAQVGIDAADAAAVVSAEASLDDALAAAADRSGVELISLRRDSAGHDACAGDAAWTNGESAFSGDGIVFHPNRRGMAAIAALVAAKVER